MSLNELISVVVAIFSVSIAIFFLWKERHHLNKSLSLFNLAVAGFALWFVLDSSLISYQVFQLILFYTIKFHGNLLPGIINEFTKFILRMIGLLSVSVIGIIMFRLTRLSANFNRLVQEHYYQQAIELSERRLRFVFRFFGQHYLYYAALLGLVNLYLNLGKIEGIEIFFAEASAGLNRGYFNRHKDKDKSTAELRINLDLKISSSYLLLGNLNKAEVYCQKTLDLQGSKGLSKILFAQAFQLMALIQGFKGNIDMLMIQSDKARNIYQNWVEDQQEFRWVSKKNNSADASSVGIVSLLILIPGALSLLFLSSFYSNILVIITLLFITTLFFIRFIGLQLEKSIKQNSEKHEAIVQYYSLIEQEANFYQSLGNYELAEKKYEQVKKELSNIQENSISKQLVIAQSLLNKASLHRNRGMRELLSLDKKQECYKIAILNYDEALIVYQSINNCNTTFFPIQYRDLHVKCLLERYLAYAELVGIDIAESEVLQAFDNAKKLLPYPNVQYADMLIRLGEIYSSSRKNFNSEEQYLKAEEILENYPEVSLYTNFRLNFAKARLYATQGRSEYALESMRKSHEFATKQLLKRLSITSDKYRINDIQTTQFYLNSYAKLVCKFFSNSPLIVGELFDQVLQRKAIGSEVLKIQRELIVADRYANLKNILEKLTNLRRDIAQKTLKGPTVGEDKAIYFSYLKELNFEKERLEEELTRKIPELNLEKSIKLVNRQTVSQALPLNSVLIEIVLVDFVGFTVATPQDQDSSLDSAHYLAFVLHAKQPDKFHMIDLGSAVSIDHLIARFRDQITKGPRSKERNIIPYSGKSSEQQPQHEQIGFMLRSKIFDPLLPKIKNKKQILISTDANLTQIPFEILPTDDGRELIDLYSISYLSAGRDVLRFDLNVTKQATAPIVIADPDFDHGLDSTSQLTSSTTELSTRQSREIDQGKFSFARLPGTHQEGETIAKLLNAQKWLEKKALKQQFFKSVRSPSILHIATHGFFLENQQPNSKQKQLLNTLEQFGSGLENPLLRSGLALAGANCQYKNFTPLPEAGNGILTAEEVSGLDLSATELVVLSACETGLGETLVGEGVFGLRRTFVLAGAKTLIMSLWQVPDQQTQELMVDFYERVLSGEPRSEALKNAQLAIRRKCPHPSYWGAFICQGYPGLIPDIYRTHRKVSSQRSSQENVASGQQGSAANLSRLRSTPSLRPPIQATSARLILKRNGMLTKHEFAIINRVVVGRFDNSIDIDLGELPESQYVSHRHAVIWCYPSGQWFVTDLRSNSGTFVRTADRQVEQVLSKRLLHNGDEIILGNAKFEFQIG